jgi:kinetochore protein NNF1
MPSKQDPPPGAQQQQDTQMVDTPPPPPPQSQPQAQTTSAPPASTVPSASASASEEQQQEQQQREQEPSSDPDPPPPPPQETAAAAPIAPGPRAARLQALFASTAKHTLDKINQDNFAACFPTIAARAPGTLEFVQRQMVERLGGLWNVRLLFFSALWGKLGSLVLGYPLRMGPDMGWAFHYPYNPG